MLNAAEISFTTPDGTVTVADLLKALALLPGDFNGGNGDHDDDGGDDYSSEPTEPETLVTNRELASTIAGTVAGLRAETRSEVLL